MKISFLPESYVSLGFQLHDPRKALGRNFPDFMIIGPQRTGTTWLSEMLRRHPNVLMSQPKEPHYFDNLIKKVLYKEVTTDFMWYLSLFDVSWQKRKRLYHAFLHGKTRSLRMMRGEATASTAVILPVEYIRFLYEINPKLKIIYGLRDPVERAWSHLKLILVVQEGRALADISLDEMFDFCKREYVINCGKHSETIVKWLSVFPANQFYCLRHDILSAHPEKILHDVCRFLHVGSPDRAQLEYVRRAGKINASEESNMPAPLRAHLAQLYHDELARMKSFWSSASPDQYLPADAKS